MIKNINKIFTIITMLSVFGVAAQQDPQYTQYMYNTLSVNSAYAGSLGHLAITGIYRTQWVGLEGAPNTQSFTLDTPIAKNLGLGLSVVSEEIGPSEEQYIDANFSYTIQSGQTHKLSFGLKGGGRVINIDWTKGSHKDPDVQFRENITNKFLPVVGAGLYWHGERDYIGIAIPNFLTRERYNYDDIADDLVNERMHVYLIGGIVFDLSAHTKFKPAVLVKYVAGAPLIADFSANFMFNNAITLGASYRTGDSVSAMASLQITPQFLVGYAYDYTTTELQTYNSGTHEIMLRFELVSRKKGLKSPRFF
ncbi:PorP/SprF family type IX secretion system membrane protein [Flavobacterium johnsoniae]|jgi:type IX secretion system PorP/SprF family membrane protein|uniref:Type IX secretion system membrane protein, PorP/SprF family n=1 Tax=Flavobacterium johnsoniae TaxID=986 RepID=A0A1M5VK44_FLAJO|nr:type IX secretion system membrane protein PorP/SprF [Flavobacterium johnsoniae]SHH75560.1 type IX secretion system membrane protein, PorP/SprF family [Flavobacterium johnsoniae]